MSSAEILNKVEEYMNSLHVPGFALPGGGSAVEDIVIPEINDNISNEELATILSKVGAYQAYLDAQLANIEAKKHVVESTFEAALGDAMYRLAVTSDKRITKEILRAQALASDERLEKTRNYVVELEGIARRIIGLRDSFKTVFLMCSRIVTIRSQGRELY